MCDAELKYYITAYLKGDTSALKCLRDLGFLSHGEPATRGYVLYKALKIGIDVTNSISSLQWGDFEEFIRRIFDEFGYRVVSNLRLDCGKRAEFDVVAWNNHIVFVIEAKMWKSGNWEIVANRHLEKVKKCLSKLLAFAPSVTPLVVSLRASAISGGVPVVPIQKLGHFLASLDYFKDHILVLK